MTNKGIHREIAQHLSQAGKLIQIYSGEEIFEARRAQAVKR